MAEDTGARNRYLSAAAAASTAALLIRHPIAFYIAALLGLMTADPDAMNKAMEQWKTTQAGGKTDELATLRDSVKSLIERLEEDAKWEGETAKTVKDTMTAFLKELDKAAGLRDGVGDALGSAAKLYDSLSWVAVSIGSVMTAYAAYMAAAIAFPQLRLPAMVAINPALQQSSQTTWGLIKKQLLFLALLSPLFGGAYALSAQQGAEIQKMAAATPFIGGHGLGNDPTSKRPIPTPVMSPDAAGAAKGQPDTPNPVTGSTSK
ncbi:hypothetical protein SAMN05421505_110103 [Sinosporangium album]|uniref:Uncharacterized protein n=1 Tax=Sinosporangium album TaxID=504805 RepID=A0A1G7YXI7_9ACTN|nr:hypothetical protein [Sinosporangium album]SDH01161.1 hypothetical protein SAMN05421505_110103 [Sinosporangium album]